MPTPQQPPTPDTAAADRVRTTRAAIDTARDVHRQAIRDAHTDGRTPTQIAADLSVANRVTITAALSAPPPAEPDPPALAPVVFLVGAGATAQQWQLIATAMHRRGWPTIRDRTQAWHLARGRTPIVMVDFSAHREDTLITRVDAKYLQQNRTGPGSGRLPPAERDRLTTTGDAVTWISTPVTWTEQTPELRPIGATHTEPRDTIDAETLARTVARLLP